MSTTKHNQNLNCFLVQYSFHPFIFPIQHVFYKIFALVLAFHKKSLQSFEKAQLRKYHSSASRLMEDLEHREVRSRKTDSRTRIALSKDTKKQ